MTMRIDEVKIIIDNLQQYLDLYNSYEPNGDLIKQTYKYYAEIGNTAKVTEKLNDEGFRLTSAIKTPTELRKIKVEDVSEMLRRQPEDEFQKLVRNVFQANYRKSMQI